MSLCYEGEQSERGFVSVEYRISLIYAFLNRFSIDGVIPPSCNDPDSEAASIKKLKDELAALCADLNFYPARVAELELREKVLNAQITELRKLAANEFDRIRDQYQKKWLECLENVTDATDETKKEVDRLKKKIVQLETELVQKNNIIADMENSKSRMIMTINELHDKLLAQREIIANHETTKKWEMLKLEKRTNIYREELDFFRHCQDKLFGKLLEESSLTSSVNVRGFWTAEIHKATTCLQHVYALKLEAMSRDIKQRCMQKVRNLEWEMKTFSEGSKKTIEKMRCELMELQSQYEKMEKSLEGHGQIIEKGTCSIMGDLTQCLEMLRSMQECIGTKITLSDFSFCEIEFSDEDFGWCGTMVQAESIKTPPMADRAKFKPEIETKRIEPTNAVGTTKIEEVKAHVPLKAAKVSNEQAKKAEKPDK